MGWCLKYNTVPNGFWTHMFFLFILCVMCIREGGREAFFIMLRALQSFPIAPVSCHSLQCHAWSKPCFFSFHAQSPDPVFLWSSHLSFFFNSLTPSSSLPSQSLCPYSSQCWTTHTTYTWTHTRTLTNHIHSSITNPLLPS